MKLGIVDELYGFWENSNNLIANRNLDQLEPVYTDKVEMTVFVPIDEMGSLRAETDGRDKRDRWFWMRRQPVGLQGQKMELRFLMKNDSHRRGYSVR